MANTTRFTKIKYDGAKVRIEYEVEREDGHDPDEYTLFSCDAPAPSMASALQALAEDVIAICELPTGCLDKLKVRGVTLTSTNGILGACVTALKALKTANAPLVLNTPHLPYGSYSEGADDSPQMSDAMKDRLTTLCVEAQKYIDGERAQASLFTDADALNARAALHDSLAKLADPSGDGSTKVSFGVSGGEMREIDPAKHRAKARELRAQAAN